MRNLLTGLVLACSMMGCSGTETYTFSPRELGGQEVRVRALIDDGTLHTKTTAGRYSVRDVTLVLAEGSTLDPSLSATTQEAERAGGFRVGTGFGTGIGSGVGVGVGTSVPIGGAGRTTLTSAREARWDAPPLDKQPFTMRVTMETDPPVVTHVPLGRVVDTVTTDGVRIETWKLPDDTKRRFRVNEADEQGAMPTYEPVN